MPTLQDLMAGGRAFGGTDRRKKPRYGLMADIDDPADLEEQLMERIRTAPPEAVEDHPSGALQYALEVLDLSLRHL